MNQFIRILADILDSDIYKGLISWSDDGNYIKIYNSQEFKEFISKFFPSFTVNTFFRTLINFGFHKKMTRNIDFYELWYHKKFKRGFVNLEEIFPKKKFPRKFKLHFNFLIEMKENQEVFLNELKKCSDLCSKAIEEMKKLNSLLCQSDKKTALIWCDEDYRGKIEFYLTKLEYESYVSVSFLDSFNRIKEGKIELMVIDIKMHKSLLLILEIRKLMINTVIFMIGDPILRETADSYLYAGVNEYICKPVNEFCFIELIKKYFINDKNKYFLNDKFN